MKINDTNTITMTVEASDTAQGLGSGYDGKFPAVLATPRMVGLMEYASSQLMEGQLQDGQLSVGVGVNIIHMAATPVGEAVNTTATYLGMEGKLHKFKVEAFDRAGLIGKGEHTRAIVDIARIMAGAQKRYKAAE